MPKKEQREAIFIDKLYLSYVLVNKEFLTINQINNLHKKLRLKELTIEDLQEDETYLNCWQNLCELYSFLEFEYISLVETDENGKAMAKKCNEIVKYFKTPDKLLEMKDLIYMEEAVRMIMVRTGFHNVSSGKSKVIDTLAPTHDWTDNDDMPNFELLDDAEKMYFKGMYGLENKPTKE